jgi:hypothetical protein
MQRTHEQHTRKQRKITMNVLKAQLDKNGSIQSVVSTTEALMLL